MRRPISKPATNEDKYVALQNDEENDDDHDDNDDDDATWTSSDESKPDEDYDEEEKENPVWTFRVVFLGSISCVILFILNKFFFYQTAECMMSMISCLFILYPLGYIMSKFLPKRRILLQKWFRLEISLNPGPFDIKEFVMISILANSGAAYGGSTNRYIPHLLP